MIIKAVHGGGMHLESEGISRRCVIIIQSEFACLLGYFAEDHCNLAQITGAHTHYNMPNAIPLWWVPAFPQTAPVEVVSEHNKVPPGRSGLKTKSLSKGCSM